MILEVSDDMKVVNCGGRAMIFLLENLDGLILSLNFL